MESPVSIGDVVRIADTQQVFLNLLCIGLFFFILACKSNRPALFILTIIFFLITSALTFIMLYIPDYEILPFLVFSGGSTLYALFLLIKHSGFLLGVIGILIIVGSSLGLGLGSIAPVSLPHPAAPYPAYFHQEYGMQVPVMNDPLSQSSGSNWQTSGGTCRFSDQAYHVKTLAINPLNVCYGQTTKFQNLTYQVDMTIVQGDCGGILFGENSTHTAFYLFLVCQDRHDALLEYTDNSAVKDLGLSPHTSKEIIPGVGQKNRIAVLIQGNSIYFYIGNQQVAEIHGTSYSGGYIGLVAYTPHGDATEVAYKNVNVWVSGAN